MMADKAFYLRGWESITKFAEENKEQLFKGHIKPKHVRYHSTEPPPSTDYAFEMATSNVRYGPGVTREIGWDVKDLRASTVAVFTDPNLKKIKNSPVDVVLQSLADNGVKFELYSNVRVEPTDESFKEAIRFASQKNFDAFIAVGGGSVMDTCKAANLYSTYKTDNFLDYVNPPIGKGLPPPGPLKPLIAVPTTAGTGSETTGVAIFDLLEMNVKTGIAHRLLKPTLAIVDPHNTRTAPSTVATASGFDVLCHALESYTATPYNHRSPRPPNPKMRPAYQGANPISDVWSLKALEMLSLYFVRAVENPDDEEARSNMMLAATYAGIGFGNAGVHLCHGMSYPVSGMVRSYQPEGYPKDHPIIPHGLSVALHAPAVFRFTSSANPQRHLQAARALGVNTTNLREEDASKALVDRLLQIMSRLKVPNGLKALGFTENDIPELVQGTLPQHRVIKLSPRPVGEQELTSLFKESMKIY
jgi:hydroxyacid-oxoacid transhydrogenase